MKHIKTFENIDQDADQETEDFKNSLKNYIVWYSDDYETLILKTRKDLPATRNNGNACCRVEYQNRYIKRTKTLVDETNKYKDKVFSIDKPETIKRSLYQSDDLQDCIDMLTVLSDTQKYNL